MNWMPVRFLIALIVVGLVTIGYVKIEGFGPTYSEGFRVGKVIKASTKGFICKSVAAEIAMDAIGSEATRRGIDASPFANVWEFGSSDPKIIAQLKEAGGTGRVVRVDYQQWILPPWCLWSDYEAVKITIVSP